MLFTCTKPFTTKSFSQPVAIAFRIVLFVCGSYSSGRAQGCPPNIDFESGTFSNWTCWTGNTAATSGSNQIMLSPSGPTPDRHTMFTNSGGGEKDPYGGFPVNCPNGSGRSIRLGNDMGGGEAEGISYEFTIPANQDEYSLIYHYAVVFQDPVHEVFQQPRMVVEVTNVSDNETINCSSFTFIPFGTILPGFFESPVRGSDGTAVWCKNWSAVSVNLDGLAGKTIRLFFKTADCTFRRHFGYAYIDVNSECSSEFVGASFCPDDTAVTVTAPYGYQRYTWYNSDFSQVLGRDQAIRFDPPPSAGTMIAVEVIPFDGYGCVDTLYARLLDTLRLNAFAGPDKLFCGDAPVVIGSNPKPGLVYTWLPSAGLTNAAVANPFASPTANTVYELTVRNSGGGCTTRDTVVVRSSSLDNSIEVLGKTAFCFGTGDSTVFVVQPTEKIQWFRNGSAISGAVQPYYRATQSGAYSAQLTNSAGCIATTEAETVQIDVARPGVRYPIEYAVINKPYTLQARNFGNTVLWQPATRLNNPSLLKPTFNSPVEQSYTIRIVTNTGCVTVDTLQVKVVPYADIIVPTAFTPNRDGRNDLLQPVLMGIKEFRYFRVYNRWGQLMHQSSSQSAGWNGTLNGKPVESGVVVWVAEGLGADGQIHLRKGTTVLIR